MTPAQVSLGAWVAFGELVGPALAVMLAIGLSAESSVPFILKLGGMVALTAAAGPWMMQGLEDYATHLFLAVPGLLHG
jgi:flagellar biosynthesis protein FliQ